MIKGSFKRPIPCRRAFMTTSILCSAVLAVSAAFAQQALPAPVETDSVEAADVTDARSEEHTSELQSLMRISYAVFCLKKTKKEISIPRQTDTKTNHSSQLNTTTKQ